MGGLRDTYKDNIKVSVENYSTVHGNTLVRGDGGVEVIMALF